MLNLLKRLVREEEGQGMIEYALIAGLISIIAIVTVLLIGDDVALLWENVEGHTQNGVDGLTPPTT